MFSTDPLTLVEGDTLSAARLAKLLRILGAAPVGGSTEVADAERIDRIALLKRLKSALAAEQAAQTAAFTAAQFAGKNMTQARREKTQRSVNGQVALARQESPFRGGLHVGAAQILTGEMPRTLAALQTGEITEYQAIIMVKETATLTLADRRSVDEDLAGKLGPLNDKQVAARAAAIGYRLDPHQAVERHRRAAKNCGVSVRPAADGMCHVTATVPLVKGVSAFAALDKHAGTAKAAGDNRSRGAIMVEEFVNRIVNPEVAATHAVPARRPTGAEPAVPAPVDTPAAAVTPVVAAPTPAVVDPVAGQPSTALAVLAPAPAPAPEPMSTATLPTTPPAVPGTEDDELDQLAVLPTGVTLDIQLVMTDRTLLDGDNEPAILTGYGPIPAPLARRLAVTAIGQLKAFFRRLYTDPTTGRLTDMDSRRRTFPASIRDFVRSRDQDCSSAWCGAPIRHTDHTVAHAQGGATHVINADGKCEGCNYLKEAPGWKTAAIPGGGITTTTPTGHEYRSDPPPPPRSEPWVADHGYAHPVANYVDPYEALDDDAWLTLMDSWFTIGGMPSALLEGLSAGSWAPATQRVATSP